MRLDLTQDAGLSRRLVLFAQGATSGTPGCTDTFESVFGRVCSVPFAWEVGHDHRLSFQPEGEAQGVALTAAAVDVQSGRRTALGTLVAPGHEAALAPGVRGSSAAGRHSGCSDLGESRGSSRGLVATSLSGATPAGRLAEPTAQDLLGLCSLNLEVDCSGAACEHVYARPV